MPWRTLIVEDEPITNDVLRALMDADDRFEVVMALRDARWVVQLATHSAPDLIVLDVQMTHGQSGVAALPELRAALPSTKIVMHTAYGEEAEYLALGADAMIRKGEPLHVVLERIADAAAGEVPSPQE